MDPPLSITILDLLKSFLGHELGEMVLSYQLLKMLLPRSAVDSVVSMRFVEGADASFEIIFKRWQLLQPWLILNLG
ncbi:unnamed protein product [Prunus armeniaca]